MKRIICLILSCALFLSACSSANDGVYKSSSDTRGVEVTDETSSDIVGDKRIADSPGISFTGLDDDRLITYVEDNIYEELVSELNSEEYLVENVEAIYYPKEYIEALESNSRSNIYFGFTAEELDAQFQGTRYVFTLGEDGKTVVVPMEIVTDDVYIKAMEDVLIGTGVILICVTVSVVSAPLAPAVSMIFATSASTGTVYALESGGIGFIAAGIVKGYETENFDQALKAAVSTGSEYYKWGSVTGVVTGGVKEAASLKKLTLNGLSMNEAALIQKESGWPVEAIQSLHSQSEYEVYRDLGLTPAKMEDGSIALVQDIDWSLVDSKGRTNIQRVSEYKIAPIDAEGKPYELHHIGMREDSPLAILPQKDHHDKRWYKILHYKEEGKNISDVAWEAQKDEFWDAILKMAGVVE